MTAFTDSVAAFAEFDRHRDQYDLILTDMTMPSLSGTELTEKILAVAPKMPIILCSGYSEFLNGEKACSLGIREYLMKPVPFVLLGKTVREVLDKSKKEIA